jgi:hypothetical protein
MGSRQNVNAGHGRAGAQRLTKHLDYRSSGMTNKPARRNVYSNRERASCARENASFVGGGLQKTDDRPVRNPRGETLSAIGASRAAGNAHHGAGRLVGATQSSRRVRRAAHRIYLENGPDLGGRDAASGWSRELSDDGGWTCGRGRLHNITYQRVKPTPTSSWVGGAAVVEARDLRARSPLVQRLQTPGALPSATVPNNDCRAPIWDPTCQSGCRAGSSGMAAVCWTGRA